ncbi:MAG: PD-(D/E)XK nuclease family protein [Actinobacteria bacterium]|nr:PD-(D/E)XK nuclease family protein [Actinomycetota bacterium]
MLRSFDLSHTVYEVDKQVYSITEILTYIACPRRYLYLYVFRLPQRPSKMMEIGILIHRKIEQVLKQSSSIMDLDFPSSFQSAEDIIDEGESLFDQRSSDVEQSAMELALNFQKSRFSTLPDDCKVISEQRINYRLNNFFIVAKIDLAYVFSNESVELVDFKTSSVNEESIELHRRQLRGYVLALSDSRDIDPSKIKCTLVSLTNLQEFSFKFPQDELYSFRDEMIEAVDNIRRGIYSAKEGLDCRYCDYARRCEERGSE